MKIPDQKSQFSESANPYDCYKTIRNQLRKHSAIGWIDLLTRVLHDIEHKNVDQWSKTLPWKLLLMAKWVLMNWDECEPKSSPGHKEFVKFYSAVHDLGGLANKYLKPGPDKYLMKFFRQMAFQQFWFQRRSLDNDDIGRQILLFRKSTIAERIAKEFQSAVGIDIDDFFDLLLATWLRFYEVGGNRTLFRNWFDKLNVRHSKETIDRFLESLSLDIPSTKQFLWNQVNGLARNNDDKWRFQIWEQSPLKDRPLLKLKEEAYLCYSPSLLGECFRYFIYDRLKLASPNFGAWFGPVMEKYVENRLRTTNIDYVPEKSLKDLFPGERVVDFLIPHADATVLIDSKAVELSYVARVKPDPVIFDQDLKNSIGKAATQIFSTARQIKEKCPDNIRTSRTNFVGVIVTYKEMYLGHGAGFWDEFLRSQVLAFLESKGIAEELIKSNNLFVISLESFDDLVRLAKHRNVPLANLLCGFAKENTTSPKFSFDLHLQGLAQVPRLTDLCTATEEVFDRLHETVARADRESSETDTIPLETGHKS